MNVKLFNQEDRLSMRENHLVGATISLRFAILKFRQSVYKEHNCILAYLIMRKFMKYINDRLKPMIMETWNENDNWHKNKKNRP